MQTSNSNSLTRKINRAFILQGGLIAVAAIFSVFFATMVINEILIKQAIKQEAVYFWKNHDSDDRFQLPETSNLTGYFDQQRLPDHIKDHLPADTDFTEINNAQGTFVLYVSQHKGRQLYLLYNRGDVDSLAAYYGLVPLTFVLMVLYLSLWLAYRFSHRAVSPVVWLADQVNKLDFASADFSAVEQNNLPYDTDDDIRTLSDAIVHLGERLEAFIARERNFTRDASHELRSPLTVIKIAADMLLSEQELATPARNSVMRIKRAIADMEELIQAFLLLARESDRALSTEDVYVNDIVEKEIERAKLFIDDKPLRINYRPAYRLRLRTSDQVLSILLGNIIRNAVLYTHEGDINIELREHSIVVQDSGEGMPEQQLKDIFKPYYRGKSDHRGHGVGLTIVKRLSDRFNWPIEIETAVGMGTRIEILFPESESEALT